MLVCISYSDKCNLIYVTCYLLTIDIKIVTSIANTVMFLWQL